MGDVGAAAFRLCYGALHVVPRPDYRDLGHSLDAPGAAAELERFIDWDATAQLRRDLDAHGVGVAEAMDTAQRFFLGWPAARRLIAETGALGLASGFCAGAGTDQAPRVDGLTDLVDAVVEQCAYISSHGGVPVILPMPWLSEQRASESQYVDVYAAIIRQVRGPVFVHWLGPMFLPSLAGYFPGRSFDKVMELDPSVVRGCKLSLLDRGFEERVRRRLLEREQLVLTGDDFHFGQLIKGDGAAPTRTTKVGDKEVALGDFSHALLGILDATAQPTRAALDALARGDEAEFSRRMERCEALGQHVFGAPTQHYKAGLAFLAWLNGQQEHFLLINREDRARDRGHYLRCAALAREAGCVRDEATFAARLAEFEAGPWPDAP